MKKPLFSPFPAVQGPVQGSRFSRSTVRRFPSHRFNVLTLLTFLTLPLCGCQVLSYTSPTGERFTRSSFAAATSISSLSVESTTNGIHRVELRGYTNDSSQALGAVTEAAVRAAIQGAK